jgi:hypothetical protein
MSTSVDTGLNPFNFIRKHITHICLWDVSYVPANLSNDFDGLRSIVSEMSINFLSLSLDGLPFVRRLTLSIFHELSQ